MAQIFGAPLNLPLLAKRNVVLRYPVRAAALAAVFAGTLRAVAEAATRQGDRAPTAPLKERLCPIARDVETAPVVLSVPCATLFSAGRLRPAMRRERARVSPPTETR